jgi:hypothetical protein
MSFNAGYIRFMIIWSCFSLVNAFIFYRALESPMRSSTPKLVYAWYQKVYDASYMTGIVGYFVMVLAFLHFPMFFGYNLDEEADIFMVPSWLNRVAQSYYSMLYILELWVETVSIVWPIEWPPPWVITQKLVFQRSISENPCVPYVGRPLWIQEKSCIV